MLKHIVEKQSEEGVTAHKLNPEDEGQKATANEPEVIVYVPSCKSVFYLCCYLYPLPIFLSMYIVVSRASTHVAHFKGSMYNSFLCKRMEVVL